MDHDEEMWQDYDYHQNTGELPEYFDDDSELDDEYWEELHVECPECHCTSLDQHRDGSFSCRFCGTRFFLVDDDEE